MHPDPVAATVPDLALAAPALQSPAPPPATVADAAPDPAAIACAVAVADPASPLANPVALQDAPQALLAALAPEPGVADAQIAPAAPHTGVADALFAPAAVPPPAILLSRPPRVRPWELLAMLAIIVLADLGLYQSAGGLGRAIMFAGVPAVLVLAARTHTGSRRFATIAALLALVAIRCAWSSSAAVTTLGIVLLAGFTVAMRTRQSFLPELASSALGSALGALRQLAGFGAAAGRLARPVRGSRATWIAVCVPAGLVVVFGAIFAAANPAIQGWLAQVADAFDGIGWLPGPSRFVFWTGCALAAAGLLRPVVRSVARLDARLGLVHDSEPTADDPAAAQLALARNVMLALNVLFLGYNALDAVYLWGGHAPSGVTHTEYAHAGTVWLTVAFVLSTIVLGAVFRGPIEHSARGRFARGLAYAWAGQNLILAAGTFRRITMYVAYSGLTELRIVGIVGTSLATLGLAIVVCKIARRRTMLWVMRRQLDALAIAVVAFLVAPTDELAMRYNVARIAADQYRPLLHLYEQPIRAEAVPALLPLLDHPDPVVRAGIAVLIAAQRDRLRAEDAAAVSWLDFELARHRALAAVDDEAGGLADALPIDRDAAAAQLRGVAYGVNAELESEDDGAAFDWHVRRYPPRGGRSVRDRDDRDDGYRDRAR